VLVEGHFDGGDGDWGGVCMCFCVCVVVEGKGVRFGMGRCWGREEESGGGAGFYRWD